MSHDNKYISFDLLTKVDLTLDITQTKDKNDSMELIQLMARLAQIAITTRKNTIEAANIKEKIEKIAEEQNIADSVLRAMYFEQFRALQVSKSTMYRYLPAKLKNPNMIRKTKNTAKDPSIKEWQIECPVQTLFKAANKLTLMGKTKAIITHDDRRVTDIS